MLMYMCILFLLYYSHYSNVLEYIYICILCLYFLVYLHMIFIYHWPNCVFIAFGPWKHNYTRAFDQLVNIVIHLLHVNCIPIIYSLVLSQLTTCWPPPSSPLQKKVVKLGFCSIKLRNVLKPKIIEFSNFCYF